MEYAHRLYYALIHILVPIPNPKGWYHWWEFPLWQFITIWSCVGFLFGYIARGGKK